MNKIKVLFGTVNSPKLGSSPAELEHTYQHQIRPILKTFYAHPKMVVTLYFSGFMLEWLQAHHSEYVSALSEMVEQRRVELLGGGYYDPIFPIIPRQDRISQIEHLTTKIRQTFGRRPRGAWVTNFFWEPDMPSFLHSAGIEYTFLDDTFFERAGLEQSDLFYPVITEDQGKILVVFPVSGAIRRMFWHDSPEAVVQYVEAQANPAGDRVAVILHDFSAGGPLQEAEAISQTQWLNRFIVCLEESQSRGRIDLISPSRLLKQPRAMSPAYFEAPTLEAVHAALLGQSSLLPTNAPLVPLPGINRLGYFTQKSVRHSLARYPEANLLYAKMQYIASLINQLRGDKVRKQTARESLWKAQHHAPYWHGPDGGLYQNRFRKFAYASLIEAEQQTRERGIFVPSFILIDYDFDNVEEILYQGHELNAYIHRCGGLIFELDYQRQPWNYADSCSRHPEMYHLSAHELDGFDGYDRRIFVDHILEPNLELAHFMSGNYHELGPFLTSRYDLVELRREDFRVHLACQGLVGPTDKGFLVHLSKTYQFEKQTVRVSYELTNQSLEPQTVMLAPEINLSFLSKDIACLQVFTRETRAKPIEIGPDPRAIGSLAEMIFHDLAQRVAISVTSSILCDWWSFPLITNTKTAAGFIRAYQASCLVPRWQFRLEPGQAAQAVLELSFSRLPSAG